MKKKPWNNLNTEIELTSLLDVIFIVLMIVICSQQLTSRQKENEAEERSRKAQIQMAEAQEMMDEAQQYLAEHTLLEDHISDILDAKNETGVITVYLDYQPSDPKNRTILVYADDQKLRTLALTGADTAAVFASLEQLLEEQLRTRKEQPVFITVDKSRILYRDEQTMQEMLDRLTERNQNLYLRSRGGGKGQ